MRSLALSLVIGASLALPAVAQKMGGTNQDAPRVSQTVAYGNSKISLDYWSVTWAEGKFMDRLGDERMRDYINKKADEQPLGDVKLDAALKISNQVVAAGAYSLAFKVHTSGRFYLELKAKKGDEVHRWGLRLTDSDDHSNRLKIVLTAGQKKGACDLEIRFGGKACKVAGVPAEAKSKPTTGKPTTGKKKAASSRPSKIR